MPSLPNTKTLFLGLTVGLLIGGAVGATLTTGADTSGRTSLQTPAVTSTSSGTGCYNGSQANAGWMHTVASGEAWAATMNMTIIHSPGTELAVNVSQRPTGTYEIAVQTEEATRTKAVAEKDCQPATTLTIAASLDRPNYVLTVDNRTIQSVNQEETVANLYSLPDPINITQSSTTRSET